LTLNWLIKNISRKGNLIGQVNIKKKNDQKKNNNKNFNWFHLEKCLT